MAITSNVAINKWYQENTSVWTLDYPPFFAWFEYGLSKIANAVDPSITVLSKQPVHSLNATVFQRLSVVVTDLLYLVGSVRISSTVVNGGSVLPILLPRRDALTLLLVLNAGLFLVDNVHFQYNGLLFGVLLLSMNEMLQGNVLLSSAYFAALLNLKQLFLYIAPAYGVYILRNYLISSTGHDGGGRFLIRIMWKRCCGLILVSIAVFSLSLGPFLYAGQLDVLLKRLFPFRRGLTHAYWAPNFWAGYNVADLSLRAVCLKLNLPCGGNISSTPQYTTGIVQEFTHLVLPAVTPLTTVVLVLLGMSPLAVSFVFSFGSRPFLKPESFVRMLVLCAFSSFVFGWHVHEKGIITVVVPMTILALRDRRCAKIFLLMSFVGHASLFPLLLKPFETILKYGVHVIYFGLSYLLLSSVHGIFRPGQTSGLLSVLEWSYVFGMALVELYCSFVHSMLFSTRLPFVPLMLMSIYCAVGVTYSWLLYCYYFFTKEARYYGHVKHLRTTR